MNNINTLILQNLNNILFYIESDLKQYCIDFNLVSGYKHFQVENGNYSSSDICKKLMSYKIIDDLKLTILSGKIDLSENGILNLRILIVCNSNIQDSTDIMEQLFNQYYSGLITSIKRTVLSNLFVTIYLDRLKVKLHVRFMDYKNSSWNFPQFNDYSAIDSFSRPNINYSFKRHSKCTFMPTDPNNLNIANDVFVISDGYADFIKPEDLFL